MNQAEIMWKCAENLRNLAEKNVETVRKKRGNWQKNVETGRKKIGNWQNRKGNGQKKAGNRQKIVWKWAEKMRK